MGPRWCRLVVVLVAGLCVLQQPEPCSAQLTQSLGWGSAGSPGKRTAAANGLLLRACTTQADLMEDLMILIEREAARQRMCRERRR